MSSMALPQYRVYIKMLKHIGGIMPDYWISTVTLPVIDINHGIHNFMHETRIGKSTTIWPQVENVERIS